MPRILVVEDSPTQARGIQFLLEAAGFHVESASDGVEALSAIRHSVPDLVLTDMQMPRMDGLALVEAVRQDYPFVPVVLITAHGSEAVAARALRDGAASYVPKRDIALDLVPTLSAILAVAGQQVERRRVLECLTCAESQFLLDNDVSLITPLVQHLEDQVAALGLCDPTDLIRIGVALREALVNAIEHGNLELGAELRRDDEEAYRGLAAQRRQEEPYHARRVYVTARMSRDEVSYLVRDEGPGFDVSTFRDAADPAVGRGLLLIRTFMDEVTFNEAGNQITLIKRRTRRDLP